MTSHVRYQQLLLNKRKEIPKQIESDVSVVRNPSLIYEWESNSWITKKKLYKYSEPTTGDNNVQSYIPDTHEYKI